MNGLGERAGNAALEEIVAALVAHREEIGAETGIDPAQLAATSGLVAELSGYPLSPHKPVVGSNTGNRTSR